MNTPHPHAAAMALYAQDAAETSTPWDRWQARTKSEVRCMPWVSLDEHPSWSRISEYRRKPKTIRIGEFDVPEPLREGPPQHQTNCWVVDLQRPVPVEFMCWTASAHDRRWLARGLLHLTREDAELHAKALLSFTEQRPCD